MFVHFVGIRYGTKQYINAVKIWGVPDFYHHWHDNRMYGDIAETDTVIFGDKGRDTPSKYSWQDHENQ